MTGSRRGMLPAMSTVSQDIGASPAEVFAVLADGWTYAGWVVGTAHIRRMEPGWPALGTRIHHSVGPWPLHIHDTSEVLEVEDGRRLTLRVRFWPAGQAIVHFELAPISGGCRMTMRETVTAGPVRWLPFVGALLTVRNRETLSRLTDLATNRRHDPASDPIASPGS
jgi:uncharacterized protein YndB with AHSA1/START domain